MAQTHKIRTSAPAKESLWAAAMGKPSNVAVRYKHITDHRFATVCINFGHVLGKSQSASASAL